MRGSSVIINNIISKNMGDSRIVRHGLQHGIVELDGPRDEQRGMGCLGGHSGGRL